MQNFISMVNWTMKANPVFAITLLIILLSACGGRRQSSSSRSPLDAPTSDSIHDSINQHSSESIQTIHIAMLKGPSAMGMIYLIDSLYSNTAASNTTRNSTHPGPESPTDIIGLQDIGKSTSTNSAHKDDSTHFCTEQHADIADSHDIAANAPSSSTHPDTEQTADISDHHDVVKNTTTAGCPKLSVKIYNEPMLVRKAVIDGTADFAALPLNIAVILYNKGLPYSLVAVPLSGSLYLAGSDTTIKSWNDLRGRTIHIMAKGMTPDLLFRYLLSQNGLRPEKDVILDYNFPTHTDMASALASGRVQLGVISEPYLSLVSSKNHKIHPLIDLNNTWAQLRGFDIPETAFLVKTKLLEEQPEVVNDIINDYASSIAWVEAHHESAARLMVKHGIIADMEAARTSIPQTRLSFKRAKDYKNEIDAYLRTLYEISPEIIGGKLPDEAFYQ